MAKVPISNWDHLYNKLIDVYFKDYLVSDRYDVKITCDYNLYNRNNLEDIKYIINNYCDIDYENVDELKTYSVYTSLNDKHKISFNCKIENIIDNNNINDDLIVNHINNIIKKGNINFIISFKVCDSMYEDYLSVSII